MCNIDLTADPELSKDDEDDKDTWVTICHVKLTMYHKAILTTSKSWLDDLIIIVAQYMLKQQHPSIGGFQPPALSQNLAMILPQEQFVQIVNVNKNHWIALSTVGCQKACVRIYDCNGGKQLPKSTLKLISALLQTQEDQFAVEFIDVQMQEGSHDCGLFAVAYITSICNGQDPAVLLYKQNAMRKHILKSIEDGVMSVFPSSASRCPKASARKSIPVYCICRHINDGSKMIQCDSCQQWLHVACMKIDKSVHKDRRSQWNCSLCSRNLL